MSPSRLLHSIIMTAILLVPCQRLWSATEPPTPVEPAAEDSKASPPPVPAEPTTENKPAPTPAPTESREHRLNRELATRIDKKTQLWLDGGQGEEFLGVFNREHSGAPQGLLLLLPDRGQLADSPGILRQLHADLPPRGWSTLSVSLPDFDEFVTAQAWAKTLPARPDQPPLSDTEFDTLTQAAQAAAEEAKAKAAADAKKASKKNAAESKEKTKPKEAPAKTTADCEEIPDSSADPKPATNEAPKKSKKKKLPPCPKKVEPPPLPVVKPYQSPAELEQAYRQQLNQRFDQLLVQTKSLSSGQRVVLAQGASGGLWIQYLLAQNTKPLPIDALILLNAYSPSAQPEPQQAEQLCKLPLAILDLTGDVPGQANEEQRQRRQHCQRQQKRNYRSQSLAGNGQGDDQPGYLAGLIRGWLTRQAVPAQTEAAKPSNRQTAEP